MQAPICEAITFRGHSLTGLADSLDTAKQLYAGTKNSEGLIDAVTDTQRLMNHLHRVMLPNLHRMEHRHLDRRTGGAGV